MTTVDGGLHSHLVVARGTFRLDIELRVAAGEVVRIRSRPETSGQNDNSIYRYDRAGLLTALSRGVQKDRANG